MLFSCFIVNLLQIILVESEQYFPQLPSNIVMEFEMLM